MFIGKIITDAKYAIESALFFDKKDEKSGIIHQKALSVLLQLGLGIAANVSVIAYQLYQRKFVYLGIMQMVKFVTFSACHPLIPAFAVIGTAALVTLVALRIITGEWKGLDLAQSFAQLSLTAVVGLGYPSLVIHEVGHYLASYALFKNPGTLMTILPFKGGDTNYAISWGLTGLGKLLGKTNCLHAVAAAGMASSMFVATLINGLSSLIQEQYPHCAEILQDFAFIQLLQEFIYGLHALLTSSQNLENDFIRLWRMGNIHPAIPLTLIAIAAFLPEIIRLCTHSPHSRILKSLNLV